MPKRILYFFFICLIIGTNACLVMQAPYSSLAPGPWRAILQIEAREVSENKKGAPLPDKVNIKFEEVNDGELPFVFDVIYDNDSTFHLEIINAGERIRVDDITIGRDRRTAKDTILINFPIYDSYIKGIYEEGILEGKWFVNYRNNYSIPFRAYQGKNHRFTTLKKTPILDMTGKWEITFNDEPSYPAIGEFKQTGNHLQGTFLTETGDYRFLEGTVQENKFYLSCFDGSHAFLFEGKILEDESVIGTFRSGKHYKTTWEGRKNPAVTLANPDSLTYIKEGYDDFNFAFENTAGKLVSLEDEQYQNKAKIIQIVGTWCPNCRDETSFLVDYLNQHPKQDLEVIAVSFERHREKEKAIAALQRYQEHFNMNYELLLGGYYNKKEAAESFPMLNHILSYPTMIFLDKNNKVQGIHTGFSGPATSSYPEFKRNFDKTVANLLSN